MTRKITLPDGKVIGFPDYFTDDMINRRIEEMPQFNPETMDITDDRADTLRDLMANEGQDAAFRQAAEFEGLNPDEASQRGPWTRAAGSAFNSMIGSLDQTGARVLDVIGADDTANKLRRNADYYHQLANVQKSAEDTENLENVWGNLGDAISGERDLSDTLGQTARGVLQESGPTIAGLGLGLAGGGLAKSVGLTRYLGVVGESVGGKLPGWVGKGVQGAIAALPYTVPARAGESAMEAEAALSESFMEGYSEEEARDIANRTFWGNETLSGWDSAQAFILFAGLPAPLQKVIQRIPVSTVGKMSAGMIVGLGKFAGVSVLEGQEESYQAEVAEWAKENQLDAGDILAALSPVHGMKEHPLEWNLGALSAGAHAAPTMAYGKLAEIAKDKGFSGDQLLRPEYRKQRAQEIAARQKAVESGVEQEDLSELDALPAFDETEEGAPEGSHWLAAPLEEVQIQVLQDIAANDLTSDAVTAYRQRLAQGEQPPVQGASTAQDEGSRLSVTASDVMEEAQAAQKDVWAIAEDAGITKEKAYELTDAIGEKNQTAAEIAESDPEIAKALENEDFAYAIDQLESATQAYEQFHAEESEHPAPAPEQERKPAAKQGVEPQVEDGLSDDSTSSEPDTETATDPGEQQALDFREPAPPEGEQEALALEEGETREGAPRPDAPKAAEPEPEKTDTNKRGHGRIVMPEEDPTLFPGAREKGAKLRTAEPGQRVDEPAKAEAVEPEAVDKQAQEYADFSAEEKAVAELSRKLGKKPTLKQTRDHFKEKGLTVAPAKIKAALKTAGNWGVENPSTAVDTIEGQVARVRELEQEIGKTPTPKEILDKAPEILGLSKETAQDLLQQKDSEKGKKRVLAKARRLLARAKAQPQVEAKTEEEPEAKPKRTRKTKLERLAEQGGNPLKVPSVEESQAQADKAKAEARKAEAEAKKAEEEAELAQLEKEEWKENQQEKIKQATKDAADDVDFKALEYQEARLAEVEAANKLAAEAEAARQREMEETDWENTPFIEKALKKLFPKAKITPTRGGAIIEEDGYPTTELYARDSIEISEEGAQAHGFTKADLDARRRSGRASVRGVFIPQDNKVVIELSSGMVFPNDVADLGTLAHEEFHIAMKYGMSAKGRSQVLTKFWKKTLKHAGVEEDLTVKDALENPDDVVDGNVTVGYQRRWYGREEVRDAKTLTKGQLLQMAEESAADAYGRWRPEQGGLFKKIYNWLQELSGAVVSDRIMEQVHARAGEFAPTGEVNEGGERAEVRIEEHDTGLALGDRERVQKVPIDKRTAAKIRAAAKKAKVPEADVARAYRQKMSAYAPSRGWAKVELDTIKVNVNKHGKVSIVTEFVDIPYSFHLENGMEKAPQGKKGKEYRKKRAELISKKMLAEIEEVIGIHNGTIEPTAETPKVVADVIYRQRKWYSNMVNELGTRFGSYGDFFAELLGALSPNTPVGTNWRFAVDALIAYSSGDFDSQIRRLRDWVDDGKKIKDFPQRYKIAQLHKKLFGMNSTKAMQAMLDDWSDIKTGDKPKAKNFAKNLSGRSFKATIDVWAARSLERLAGKKRIPPMAEKAVQGDYLSDGKTVGNAYGYAEDIYQTTFDTLEKGEHAGVFLSPADIQAFMWFKEKSLWTKSGWTNDAGRGGSFELMNAKDNLHRWLAGVTAFQNDPTTDLENDLFDVEQVHSQALIEGVLRNDPMVVASKAHMSYGGYATENKKAPDGFEVGTEPTLDVEAIVRPGFNPNNLVAAVASVGVDQGQQDVFISKVLLPDEENPNARPGVEVTLKEGMTMSELQPIMREILKIGIDGFSIGVDPREDHRGLNYAGAYPQLDRKHKTIRVQWVPEIAARYNGKFRAALIADPEAAIKSGWEEANKKFDDIARLVDTVDSIHRVQYNEYDTLNLGKETVHGYTTPETQGNDRAATPHRWFGGSLSENARGAAEAIERGLAEERRRLAEEQREVSGTDGSRLDVRLTGEGNISERSREDGEGEGRFWHFSTGDYSESGLQRKYAGSGAAGAERSRFRTTDDGELDPDSAAVHLYIPGTVPEYQVVRKAKFINRIEADLKLMDIRSEEGMALSKRLYDEGFAGSELTEKYIDEIRAQGYDGMVDKRQGMAQVYRDIKPEEMAETRVLEGEERFAWVSKERMKHPLHSLELVELLSDPRIASWYGDSVVHGIAYRGTKYPGTPLDMDHRGYWNENNQIGPGFYFSLSNAMATEFATETGAVEKFLVRIQNPFVFDRALTSEEQAMLIRGITAVARENAQSTVSFVRSLFNRNLTGEEIYENLLIEMDSNGVIAEAMMAGGFDGIQVEQESKEGERSKTFVSWDPRNIRPVPEQAPAPLERLSLDITDYSPQEAAAVERARSKAMADARTFAPEFFGQDEADTARFIARRMQHYLEKDGIIAPPAKLHQLELHGANYENLSPLTRWFTARDGAFTRNSIEARRFQSRLKVLVGKKSKMPNLRSRLEDSGYIYDKNAREWDQAIHIYIDLQREPGDYDLYYDGLDAKKKAIVDMAKQIEFNTAPEGIRELAEEIEDSYNQNGIDALDAGIISNVLDHYVHREWQLKAGDPGNAGFGTSTHHAKHRKLGTILEGWSNGLELRMAGATVNLNALKDEIARTIADRELIKVARATRIADDDPDAPFLITHAPPQAHRDMYTEVKHPNFTYWMPTRLIEGSEVTDKEGFRPDTMQTKTFAVYREMTEEEVAKKLAKNPNWKQRAIKTFTDRNAEAAEQRAMEFVESASLNDPDSEFYIRDRVQIWEKQRVYAYGDMGKHLNNILMKDRSKGWAGWLKINSTIKSWILATSFFHHMAFLRSYYLGTSGKGFTADAKFDDQGELIQGEQMGRLRLREAYVSGNLMIDNMNEELMFLVDNGLTLGAVQDFEESVVSQNLDKDSIKPIAIARELRARQTNFLFKRFGAGLKAQAAMIEFQKMLKKRRGTDPIEIAQQVAALINEDFGGLHLDRMGVSDRTRRWLRLVLLAPDWTGSNALTLKRMVFAGEGAARPEWAGGDKAAWDRARGDKEHRAMYHAFWGGVIAKAAIASVVMNAILAGFDDDEERWASRVHEFKDNFSRMRWLGVDITPIYIAASDFMNVLPGIDIKPDDRRRYFSLAGHFADPLKWSTNLTKASHNKGSPLYRAAYGMYAGVDWKSEGFTDIREWLGIDEKGYYRSTGPGYRPGDPKGGQHQFHLTKRGGSGGPIGWGQLPVWMMHTTIASMPIQLQEALGVLTGEKDAVDALWTGLGIHTSKGAKSMFEFTAGQIRSAEEKLSSLRAEGNAKEAAQYRREEPLLKAAPRLSSAETQMRRLNKQIKTYEKSSKLSKAEREKKVSATEDKIREIEEGFMSWYREKF